MKIQEYKTILILFMPGQGGNHLANLISTSPYIEERFNHSTKIESITEKYKKNRFNNAHLDANIPNVGIHELDKLYENLSLSQKTYVICGHIEESYFAVEKIRDLGEIFYVVFEDVGLSDDVMKRSAPLDGTTFLYHEHRVKKLFQSESEHILASSANLLFTSDIGPMVNILNNRLGLSLDRTICQGLHDIWLKTINF
jgi:hypothetical protein